MHNYLNVYVLTAVLILLATAACREHVDEAPAVPQQFRELDNLTPHPSGTEAPDTVLFTREQVFTSTDEMLIRGYIGEFIVDHQNRVYIAAGSMGEAGIYVFAPDGSYLTRIGRHGRGPGEFTGISGIRIKGDHLYVYDSRQLKFSTFSISEFSLVHEAMLNKNEALQELLPSGRFFVSGLDTLLMDFDSNMATNEDRRNVYYRITKDGQIVPGKVVELQEPRLFMPSSQLNSEEGFRIPSSMPFSRGPLVTGLSLRPGPNTF